MLFRGGAAKTLFPMTLFAWKRLQPLASCMTTKIQMHNVWPQVLLLEQLFLGLNLTLIAILSLARG